ncbi:MAG: hypothetical protein JWM11_1119 [Planctomycetaceae bacterium]|nr:hypothetical protein [Planctomycetaceae bacterium]
MFQRSVFLAVLMMLTALIPFFARSRWFVIPLYVLWILIWWLAIAVANQVSYPPACGWLLALLIFAIPIARWTKRHWSWFSAICLGCACVAYGISMIEYLPAYREHQELLSEYPAMDLRPRLAYEHSPSDAPLPDLSNSANNSSQSDGRPPHDVALLRELEDAYRKYLDISTYHVESRRNDRRLAFQALMRVHEDFVADFIAQPGLGRSRLPFLHLLRKADLNGSWEGVDLDVAPELLDQPDHQPPAPNSLNIVPDAVPKGEKDMVKPEVLPAVRPARVPERLFLQRFHHDSITNFVPLNSLGGNNDKLEARGFQSHAFRLAPEKMGYYFERDGWRLTRLELVSLLKHRPPAVYVSEHLPAMDELRDAPTRPVTKFETNAVKKLLAGEDLVLQMPNSRELHVLGSIRAITDCRNCHQVARGGLLGAFSYTFKQGNGNVPVPPPSVKKVAVADSLAPR